MPTVLITPEALRDQEGPHTELLRSAGFDIRFPRNPQLARGVSESELIDELAGVDASLASMEPYSRRVLDAVPRLRVIARVGVGYDAVDVQAASDRDVLLTITPTANHEAVAEMALALMLGVAKQVAANDRKLRSGEWSRALVAPIRGSVLGIVGLGRIGRSLAPRAVALSMKVLAHDPYADQDWARRHCVELVDWAELLERSDFLSLHCPANDATDALINDASLARMKPGAILINTARGRLIDEQALANALSSGRLAGAGLDVLRQEPPPTTHPLLQFENVVLSPHIAGLDRLSLRDMATESARCVTRLRQGDPPWEAIVNRDKAEGWRWEK